MTKIMDSFVCSCNEGEKNNVHIFIRCNDNNVKMTENLYLKFCAVDLHTIVKNTLKII